nr:PREDICTED: myelin-associated glycoprotein-like isoform X2 [Lepisosteus oculatus]
MEHQQQSRRTNEQHRKGGRENSKLGLKYHQKLSCPIEFPLMQKMRMLLWSHRQLILYFCLQVYSSILCEDWSIDVPEKIPAFEGSCVVIPCTFKYPETLKNKKIISIWKDNENAVIFHSDSKSLIVSEFQNRTELVGEIKQNNCSLMIDRLKESDHGPFYFRIEIEHPNDYSFIKNKVSIEISASPSPSVNVFDDQATCSATSFCPKYPPSITWNNKGNTVDIKRNVKNVTNGQWEWSSSITLKNIQETANCTVNFSGKYLHLYFNPSDVLKPEILEKSECEVNGTGVSCHCIVKSERDVNIIWYLINETRASDSSEVQNSVTTATLHLDSIPKKVSCVANNTYGKVIKDLLLSNKDFLLYIYIAVPIAVLLLILLIVGALKLTHRRKSAMIGEAVNGCNISKNQPSSSDYSSAKNRQKMDLHKNEEPTYINIQARPECYTINHRKPLPLFDQLLKTTCAILSR